MTRTDLQTKHLNMALASLSKVYNRYHNQGLLSIYLWGSILREEYNPDNSDIDSLGIVEDNFPLEAQTEINKELEEASSGLRDLRINLIRLSEINGTPPITRIAKVIPPPLLLLEFDSWKHVAGDEFRRTDFTTPIISTEEAMCLNIQVVLGQYLPEIKLGDMTKLKSFVKQMMHVCHLYNEKNVSVRPFSYAHLEERADISSRKIVSMLLKIRADGYRLPNEQELETLESFIITLRGTHCHDWVCGA